MSAFEIIGGILLIVMAVVIIGMVLMQDSKGNGAAALCGAQSNPFTKNRAKTLDALLTKYTKVIGIAFLVLSLIVWVVGIYF